MKVKRLLVPLLLLMLIACSGMIMPAIGHAPGVVLSAWTRVPPTIDGIIDPAEWAPAAKMAFSMPDIPGAPTGTLYVMNDATNLYLAVMIEDDGSDWDDQCDFWFDNDHDGIGPELGDDIIFISGTKPAGAGVFTDFHISGLGPPGWTRDDWGVPPGTIDGSGDATNDGTYSYYEFSHPLDSGDIHDFSLSLGDTVGFTIWITDIIGVITWWDWWPSSSWDDYGFFGDIIIASPPPVGGVWVPINQFELLAPWITLASLITAATVSVVYVKHKKKQQN